MKNIILKSTIISLVIGASFSIVGNTLMATYVRQSALLNEELVLTGIEAVVMLIERFGIISYLTSLLGQFVLFFVPVFLGCLWLGLWHNKQIKRDAQNARAPY